MNDDYVKDKSYFKTEESRDRNNKTRNKAVIERMGFAIMADNLEDCKCWSCGEVIAGVFS